jgi:chemotaxis protein methyltransferase CheR
MGTPYPDNTNRSSKDGNPRIGASLSGLPAGASAPKPQEKSSVPSLGQINGASSNIFKNGTSNLFANSANQRDWSISNGDYILLRDAVLQLLDLDLNHYRTQQMERRLTTLLERRQATTWFQYVQSLRSDKSELDYFQEFVTINVSSFYRDTDKWNQLGEKFLPDLVRQAGAGGMSAWSVGCSIGAEAYTLAMMLSEMAPARRHRIWATDIDQRVMDRAKAGGPYFQTELRELPPAMLQRHMTPVNSQLFKVNPGVRSMVEYDRFNLLKDESNHKFDLVMCRNVVIYFTVDVKPLVYQRLARGLRPGGILFIGSTETIANYQQLGFEYLAPAFYRYVGR